ncbi:MAG TPA: ribosome maturation factor RimM [Candidatus Baltobacteraceae bacterium]|nr:ribosome maturation factor RimM [Candidatus Baltobacteraceae bacterium]
MKTKAATPHRTMANSNEIPVGRIAGVFGIHGELKCDPTSAGRTLFSAGEALRAQLADGSSHEVTLAALREHKGRLLIRLPGIDTANAAERFVGATLYADRDRIVLEPGEYLDRDLVGCDVFDTAGAGLGRVTRVEHYPSSDMLIVNGNMVPMIKQFVKTIDAEKRRIVVDVPPGLIDPSQAEEA